jgi:alkanesulfonate monooxygenase SsuD/methylene tetrahydromethanopterin reductase-like flavin-dependent oxidoreductase (luciferase family)
MPEGPHGPAGAGPARREPAPWVLERRGRVSFQVQPFPPPGDPAPVDTGLAAARLAEDLGFDAVSFGDHPVLLDCWTWLAAVAATTRRIRLGPGVACAAYRPPAATARLATDLDHLSGGRLVLGLGAGWAAGEFAALGLPFGSPAERAARLAETLALLDDRWGPAPVRLMGEDWTPRQRPRPPIMVAGGGERVTLRLVARHADACNVGGAGPSGGASTPAAVAAKLAVLRRHCAAVGRPYDDVLRTHFTGSLVLARDEADARAKRDRHAGHRFIKPEHVQTPAQAVAGFQALVGVGIQYFVVQMFDPADGETLRLLAEDVAPRVSATATSDR